MFAEFVISGLAVVLLGKIEEELYWRKRIEVKLNDVNEGEIEVVDKRIDGYYWQMENGLYGGDAWKGSDRGNMIGNRFY